jgi:HEAT repeat protein
VTVSAPRVRLVRCVLVGAAIAGALAALLPIASWIRVSRSRTAADWERTLRDPSADVRVGAARALAAFDQRAVTALTAALGDSEYSVRAGAAEALVRIGPGPVVPGMIDALRNDAVPIRANAAAVLGAFGPEARRAIPALVRAREDTNPRVRELASEALNRVTAAGPNQAPAPGPHCH